MSNRRIYRFLALLVVLGLLFLILSPVLVRAQVHDAQSAAMLLHKYGLVQGDERGFRLRDDISRAEMAKLLVLSLGLGNDAPRHVGRRDFADTAGHWAEGYISVARRVGMMRGYPDGEFRPQAKVSYAELLAVLSRLVGLEPGNEPWPFTYVPPARDAGIIPTGMDLSFRLHDAAVREDVFVLLKRTLVDVKNYAGQTLARTYLDKTAPQIILDPQPQETQYPRLTVTGTAGDAIRVTVNGADAALRDGVFEADVALRIGPNTLRVLAYDEAGNAAEATARVDRAPGSVARIEFTGPASVTVGQKAQYRVVLRDSSGVEVTDSKVAEAQVYPALGEFDLATGTFTAGSTAGEATITILAGSDQASLNLTITAGTLNRIAISPGQATLAPAESVQFEATGYDSQGNQVPLGLVTWFASAGAITADGYFTAPTTAKALTVTASAAGKSGQVTVYPLNYAAESVSLMPVTSVIRANGRTEVAVTARVLDAEGQPLSDYVGQLIVGSSAPDVMVPLSETVEVTDGVARIPLRAGTRAGTATITAATNLGKQGTLPVTVLAQTMQSVRISGVARPTFDGSTLADIEAVALDQEGNPLVSPLPQTLVLTLTVTPAGWGVFISTGLDTADIAMGAIDEISGDVRSRAVVRYLATAGTLYIDGAIRPNVYGNVTVMPGALPIGQVGGPARLVVEPIMEAVAGGVQPVAVNVLDSNGYRVTNLAQLGAIAITLRDQTGVVLDPVVPAANIANPGQALFNATQTKAGLHTYTATLRPNGATASANGYVVAAAPASVVMSATAEVITAAPTSTTVVSAEIQDQFGNRVETGTYQVQFQRGGTAITQGNATVVVPSAGGKASLPLTSDQIIGTETWSASLVALPLVTSPIPGITLTGVGVPHHLRITHPSAKPWLAGMAHKVAAEVRYQQSGATGVVANDNGRTVTLTLRNLGTGQEYAYTSQTVNGKAEFTITRPEAATFALKAESGTLIRGLSTGFGGPDEDLVLQPNGTAGIRVAADLSVLKAGNNNSYALVTAHVLDANGNVTANESGLPLTITLTASQACTDCGTFTLDDSAVTATNRTTTRTVVIPPGASASPPVRFYSSLGAGGTTITGKTLDGRTSSATISAVTTIGVASKLQVDQIVTETVEPHSYADAAVTGQTVVVTAQDTGNQRVTDYNGALTVTAAADVRIVAYYDPLLGTWTSLDSQPANGLGEADYPAPATVPFFRGQAAFRARANTPGSKVYSLAATAVATSVNAQGAFTGASPDYLSLQVDRNTGTGGGGQVSVQARIRDQFGSTLPYITGTVEFAISGDGGLTWVSSVANAGGLTANSASLQNGVATVFFQSALQVPAVQPLLVKAWAPGLKRNDGSDLTTGSTAMPATTNFAVDATPEVTAVNVVGNGTVGANAGDQIVLTFSEPVDGATVVVGLTPGSTVTAGLGAAVAEFDAATSAIGFVGLSWQGSINLTTGDLAGTASYEITSLTLDATGQTVTITLGARITGTADSVVTFTGPARLAFNGGIRDPFGSSANGPMVVTPTGGF